MSYVPLHVHDTYGSIGDAILKIDDYISRALEYNCPAIAITNHGSLSSFMTFYEKCRENNIKPIIGCEFYYRDNRLIKNKENAKCAHLILLAKNHNGLTNLIKLHNDAHSLGHYYKMRTDLTTINKWHEDLICLSACVGSPIAQAFRNNDLEKAISIVLSLKKIFRDDFYLEIQPGTFKEQIEYNDFLVRLSQKYDIKLVATNDIHYLNKEDCFAHNFHVKVNRHDKTDKFLYPDTCYYFMKEEEFAANFFQTKLVTNEVIDNAIKETINIANKCDLMIPEEHFMPVYDSNIDEFETLTNLCLEGLKKYKIHEKTNAQEYLDRLSYELDTIKQLGFPGYFLIVKDIIDYCDNNNIPRGPGRGSAGGSLVSYLLNISVADPIKYDLMFERFLSVNRKAIPDIDLDISSSKVDQVKEYVTKKYGKNKCCALSTFIIRKAKVAARSACGFLGLSSAETNQIAKTIPDIYYDDNGEKHVAPSLAESREVSPAFNDYCNTYEGLFEISSMLENYPSAMSIHPAGIVISPIDITDRYPLIHTDKNVPLTSLTLNDVEKLSGVKFDLLSLSSLEVINKTMKDCNITFDFGDDKLLEDKNVWQLISSVNNSGLFQISSDTYKRRMPYLHPQSIQELAACLALLRGPCISAGLDQTYIDIVNGRLDEEQIHPIYWKATKNTHGILIYQEQILKICMNIGFDSETAYKILKAVSKKKIALIKSYKEEFYNLGNAKKIDSNILDNIWEKIENSGLYAFNVAHATCYALVCYLSAYLKYYYPVYYMNNLLTKEYCDNNSDKDVIYKILNECKDLGIEFLPFDINFSDWNYKVENNKIRIGYCSIEGIGEKVYDRIKQANRIKDFNDFIERATDRTVNKRPILILIAANAFASLEKLSSHDLANRYMKEIRKEREWDGKIKISGKQICI